MKTETNYRAGFFRHATFKPLRVVALGSLLFCLGRAEVSFGKPTDAATLPRRGFFGVQVTAAEEAKGVRITSVDKSGLAAAIGLQPGDTILSVNGKPTPNAATFRTTLRPLRSGDRVTVQVRRSQTNQIQTMDGNLPEQPRETIAGADIMYDAVIGARGERLRTIVTKPKAATGKLPVIFLAGWLSDDSVEAPDDTKEASALVLRGLASLPDFATMRLDKPGVGDSEGNVAETDFETELAGYRAAFASLGKYDFIDPNRVFILGMSNGGGFAPLVPPAPADAARVRGYVVIGGWVKTWFEHMLEIERRRLALGGRSPDEVNAAMKEVSGFYHDYLIKGEKPAKLFERQPSVVKLWPGEDPAHLYGRPVTFYQQLQKQNLAAAWSKVTVPTLVMHGQYDWIMGREDHELIARFVNANRPGAAEFVELPNTGHTFENFRSEMDAFNGKAQPFDPALLARLTAWFEQHRNDSRAR